LVRGGQLKLIGVATEKRLAKFPDVPTVSGFAAPCRISGFWSDAAFEAPAIVAGLDDVAVVGEPVEERIGHLGVAEDGRPFAWRYS
jgi:hypothetical protein